MANTLLADNGVSSGSAGIKYSADGTGVWALQTTTAGGAATTAVTISTAQVVTLANALPMASGGTGVITMPAFSVYGSGLVTMSQNTFTKVTFDTEDFDTNNNFASNRFTPTVAGYYQIEAFIYFSVTATGGGFASIFKNGTRYCDGTNFNSTNGNDTITTIAAVVSMNGSTDYIEIFGYQGYSATAGVGSNNYLRKFCGFLVRAA
jgi:hypothetical protein